VIDEFARTMQRSYGVAHSGAAVIPIWDYTRIRGAVNNLGHDIGATRSSAFCSTPSIIGLRDHKRIYSRLWTSVSSFAIRSG
jgi:hypothetical protein